MQGVQMLRQAGEVFFSPAFFRKEKYEQTGTE
jgi:hypothetical protein